MQTMQATLGLDYDPPPRPTLYDEAVIDAATEDLVERIIPWLGTDYRESEHEDLVAQMREVIQDTGDGYERARGLEHHCWFPNSDLVEILDDCDHMQYEAREAAVAAWVEKHGIKPTRSLGDRVTIIVHNGKGLGVKYVGVISKINAATAMYTVSVVELGHKTEGKWPTGYLIDYEDAQDAD